MSEALKFDGAKPPLHLVPLGALTEIARVMEHGAAKYEAYNWTGGFAVSRLFSATLRHLFAWWGGETLDPESGRHHVAHAICCLMFALEGNRTRPPGYIDDRPPLGTTKEVHPCT